MLELIADGLIVPVALLGVYALWFYVPKGQKLQAYSYALMAGLTSLLVAKLISIVYQPNAQRPFKLLLQKQCQIVQFGQSE